MSSNRKVWWQCARSHDWQGTISHRASRGDTCPYCSGKRVLDGFNDLATTAPAVAAEWHPTKNGDLAPAHLTSGSGRRVWWECQRGHEWVAVVQARTGRHQTGCPYCANKKVLCGFNDLASTHVKVATEWHPSLNSLSPHDVTAGSNKRAWWRCNLGHEWSTMVLNRTVGGTCCPVCTGQRVETGFNDLATQAPVLAAQWHPTLNLPLLPSNVTKNSSKIVWWQADCGHSWQASVNGRTVKKTGCPECAHRAGWATSWAEQRLREALRLRYAGTQPEGVRVARSAGGHGWMCDILIEIDDSPGIVVEFDGHWTHARRVEKDRAKSDDLRALGYVLVRVRVGALLPLHPHDIHITSTQAHYTNADAIAQMVCDRLTLLGYEPDAPVEEEPEVA